MPAATNKLRPLLPILALAGLTVVFLFAAPATLRLAFIPLATIAALILFLQSRTLYIELCLWLWFLTPLLRRLIDGRTSYSDQSAILVTPFLAASISGIVLLRNPRTLSRPGGVPFACALAGILFGTVYGLTRYGLFDVGRGVINWLAPIFFGFFLYQERHRYKAYRDAFTRSLLWGTLLTSIYGIYQFFFLPSWDETWMHGLVFSVFGEAAPRKVRVFSTMNAPAVLAFYVTAGLLLILALLVDRQEATPSHTPSYRKKWFLALTAPLGLLALGLTTTRALWISFLAGILYLAWTITGPARVRVVGFALIVLIVVGAATQAPGIHEIVVTRLQSFTSGTQDVSAAARITGHASALAKLATEPLGEGMGSTDTDHDTNGSDASIGPHDSTLLEFLYSLGAPGTLIYTVGFAFGLILIFFPRHPRSQADRQPFAYAMRAATFAFLAASLLESILIGIPGFLIWACFGFALSTCEPITTHKATRTPDLPAPGIERELEYR